MSTATAVSLALSAVLIAWLGLVLAATWRQLLDEVDADSRSRRRR